MSLNYPIYDVRSGRRLTLGPSTGAWGDTYGAMIWTGAEFHHLLNHIKNKMGFHVYANSHHGGINRTAHSPKSWHYVRDAQGRSLGADIGTYGDRNERARIVNELIPLLDRLGVGWHYARNGNVPGHHDHIHIDVSNWGRKGGSAGTGYGYYSTRKKQDIYKALGGSTPAVKPSVSAPARKRKPKPLVANYGMRGELVDLVQRIVGAKPDGSFGNATRDRVKWFQRNKLKTTADGSFGPATAKAYVAKKGVLRRGSYNSEVKLVQYIAGLKMDGSYGPATEQAVREMQAWAGITQDGSFGPQTRNKLFIGY